MKAFHLLSAPLVCFCMLLLAASNASAKSGPERTQFGHDIHVAASERTGDLTCVNCSIYLRGQSAGDVTVVHGNVVLETGAQIAGDTTAVWGDIRAESGTQIGGDATAIAGKVRRDGQSVMSGDVTALEGTKWLLVIIVPPLLFMGAIVALVIWLLQRSRHNQPPVYAQPGAQPTARV
jgi:hypothetical protein